MHCEIADWPISEGAHLAASDEPFGVYQVGYTSVTSYAYPGGLRLKFMGRAQSMSKNAHVSHG